MIIKTKRLILRPAKNSDWKDLVEGRNSSGVVEEMASMKKHFYKKDAIKWIKENISNWKKKRKIKYVWVIELKSEKKVIGTTGIININYENKNSETGSWINSKYWKKGFITEAKVPLIDFAFNKLKLIRLSSVTFIENKASQKMSEKLGYKKEGKMRKSEKSFSTGKLHDQFIYGLLKEDWKKIRSKLIKELKTKVDN